MNENIKRLILELSELAINHERFRLSISGSTVIVMITPKEPYHSLDWDWCYYDCIYLLDSDTENRLKTALKFIKSLGGSKDE